MKKAISVILVLSIVLSMAVLFGGCSSGEKSHQYEKSEEEKIEEEVEFWGNYHEWKGCAIGGNEIKSARTNVTTISKTRDTEYEVNGTIVMIDVYGTEWKNRFDCTATLSGDSWKIGKFVYKDDSWTKN